MKNLCWLMACILLFTVGCSSGGNNPVTADKTPPPVTASNHYIWGLWQFTADPAAGTLDIVQLRTTDMHLNALPFLEPPPLVNLTLESVMFNGNIVDADIGLRHPFLGLDEFTGFDVCGVLITNGSLTGFNDSDLRMATGGDTRLLNPDGYTRWWNPAEFPHGATMFSYKDGLLGTPDAIGHYNATINAYKLYCDALTDPDAAVSSLPVESRCVFSAGKKNIRHYSIEMGSGLVFNYAVDANWQFPTGPKPWEIPDDFGPNANRPEAWNAAVTETTNTLWNDGSDSGGNLGLKIDLWDHYDAALNTIFADSPGNFSAVGPVAPTGGGAGYSTYQVDITSATPSQGSIDVLITALSEKTGYGDLLPGKTVSAYFIYTAEVSSTGNTPPVAVLDTLYDPPHYVCDDIIFDASGSYDPDGGDIANYEWDWDNDGNYDESGPEAQVTHSWDTAGTYYIQLRVTDDESATDTLDSAFQLEVDKIAQPSLIANLTGIFHSPFCAQVDTKNNDAWVDCTQASPILDFGFYRINNDEEVEKIFQKYGSGFLGMPGGFGLNPEARKIIAPDVLGFMNPCPVDVWDLDGGDALKFYIPLDPSTGGIAFLFDGELYGDLKTAVVADSATKPLGRLITWDYTDPDPTYNIQYTEELPNMMDADYAGHRLFLYCRGDFGGPGPTIEVWDADGWKKITSFQTKVGVFPSMADINCDPNFERLYFGSGGSGEFEAWETETYTHLKTVSTGYGGEVGGIDHMGCGIYVSIAGHLLVFDNSTFELLWDVPCGVSTSIVACNPNTHKIYVPDMDYSSVFVFQG